jgi:phosphate transport system substrate-binding protein
MFKSKKRLVAIIFMLVLSFGTAPGGWAQDLQRFQTLEGAIDIAGGTAHIPVMKEAAEQIMKTNPKIRMTVAGGG